MPRLLFTLILFGACFFLSTAQPHDDQQPIIALSMRRANKMPTTSVATFSAQHAIPQIALDALRDTHFTTTDSMIAPRFESSHCLAVAGNAPPTMPAIIYPFAAIATYDQILSHVPIILCP